MAKAKTKEIGFGVKATQDAAGSWYWTIGGFNFRYDTTPGINLYGGTTEDVGTYPMVHMPDLKSAGYFSEGFSAGRGYIERVNNDGV
jgi:hypothetical protein